MAEAHQALMCVAYRQFLRLGTLYCVVVSVIRLSKSSAMILVEAAEHCGTQGRQAYFPCSPVARVTLCNYQFPRSHCRN